MTKAEWDGLCSLVHTFSSMSSDELCCLCPQPAQRYIDWLLPWPTGNTRQAGNIARIHVSLVYIYHYLTPKTFIAATENQIPDRNHMLFYTRRSIISSFYQGQYYYFYVLSATVSVRPCCCSTVHNKQASSSRSVDVPQPSAMLAVACLLATRSVLVDVDGIDVGRFSRWKTVM